MVPYCVDYIRTFTWDKRLETFVKSSGILGGQGKMPTVVSPDLYRTRFCEAMNRKCLVYFSFHLFLWVFKFFFFFFFIDCRLFHCRTEFLGLKKKGSSNTLISFQSDMTRLIILIILFGWNINNDFWNLVPFCIWFL